MAEEKTKLSESPSNPLSPLRPSSPANEFVIMKESREKEGGGQKDRNAPPVAPQIMEKIFEMDDIAIMDPYHWLRDPNNPKVSKYLKDENAYASNVMKHTQHLQDTLYEEFVKRTQGDDQSPLLQVDDWFYYNRSEKEKQYLIHCRKFESPDAEEQIILDENEEAKGEDFFQLGPCEVSPNHMMLAYGIDTDGDERFRIFCKDLTTGMMLDEDIWDAGWTLRWAADNVTFLYTKVDKVTGRPYKVFCHTLKENSPDGSDDLELYHEPDERFVLKVNLTNNKKYFTLLIDGQVTKEVLYCPTTTPKAGFQTILGRQQGVQYTASNHGNYWYIKTNEGGAYNFKVIKAPVSDPKNRDLWEEVLPHREDVFIELIEVFRHHFVVWEWEGGVQKIRIQDLSDGEVHYINFTEPLYGVWPGEVEDQDDTLATRYFNTNRLRFSYSSFVQPTIIYDYDMDNCQKKKLKEEYVSGYSKSDYLQKRIWATAKDGAQIPISLVYKISLKNHEGGNPLLLTGYGAYGALSFPKFSVERLSLLDRGFIFAFAHVRGSAVLGWKWYEQGKLLNKINTFTDFIACAEYLIAEGYTTPSQLAIYGRSAGGLLVTAVTNMRPDLFRVVLADVPFVDVIGAMIDPKVPWTVYEWEEWGNPREKEYFHYMLKYSPYHNIKKQNYPNILVTAGLNDPRVSFWEPAKYVAKLRATKTDNNLLLLRTYLTGHMGPSGRYNAYEGRAFQYAFLIYQLGIAPSIYRTKSFVKSTSSTSVTPPELISMFQAFHVTALLSTSLQIGIFKQLKEFHDWRATSPQLAAALNVDEKALRRVLNGLVAIGILTTQRGNYYALTELAALHLIEGQPGYIGDYCLQFEKDPLWLQMRKLPLAVQKGQEAIFEAAAPSRSVSSSSNMKQSDSFTLQPEDRQLTRNENLSLSTSPIVAPSPLRESSSPELIPRNNNNNNVTSTENGVQPLRESSQSINLNLAEEKMKKRVSFALHSRVVQLSAQKHFAQQLVEILKPWAVHKKPLVILDLLCGHGIPAYTMALKKQHAIVYSFDSAEMLVHAKRTAEEMGVPSKQVHFIEGDIFQSDFGGPYDLVLVGKNCITMLDRSEALELLQKVLDVLKSTGRVVLHETIAGLDQQPYADLFSLSMLVTTRSGKVRTIDWYNRLLEEAGFATPTVYDLKPFPERVLVCKSNIISVRSDK